MSKRPWYQDHSVVGFISAPLVITAGMILLARGGDVGAVIVAFSIFAVVGLIFFGISKNE